MQRVFREYERRKEASGASDFEDLLALAVKLLEDEPEALAQVRDRYRAFTVDEYQDVNLLPADAAGALAWRARRPLRGRGRLPVDLRLHRRDAGIAARTAASASRTRRSCGLERELPLDAAGARAGEPPRSTARRRPKQLAPTLPDGPEPTRGRAGARRRRPRARAARRPDAARGDGGAHSHERPLGRLRGSVPRGRDPVPGRVAARPRCRTAAAQGSRAAPRDRPREVGRGSPSEQGWSPTPRPNLGEREQTRQADLARLVRLGEEHARPRSSAFVELLRERFGAARGRRPPADAAPREGARVGRGLPATASRSASFPSRRRDGRSTRSGVCSTWGSRARSVICS